MTEEINHAYDGGLLRRVDPQPGLFGRRSNSVHWAVVSDPDAAATIALDSSNPVNDKLTTSLRLSVSKASTTQPAGVANSGYWGIPVQSRTRYRVSSSRGLNRVSLARSQYPS